jgi:hypothetical protein
MIEHYLFLFLATLGWLALLTCACFLVGGALAWWSKPPAIDLIVILFTIVPWVGGWKWGLRSSGHWIGGVLGLLVASAAQFVALELFEVIHRGIAVRRNRRVFAISRSIERRKGWWRNRMGLWASVPSVPFFLLNRLGNIVAYGPLIVLLDFPKIKHSDYVTVSRQKIGNLVGADLVWCLYCDWMTGGWSLSTEMLNEVESYWCPLTFEDKGKCEKCSQFFRMEHWAPSDASAEHVAALVGQSGSGRCPAAEPVCAAARSSLANRGPEPEILKK